MLNLHTANSPTAKAKSIGTHNHGERMFVPAIAPLNKSVPYVNGRQYEIGLSNIGKLERGINRPHKNSIGKRKKSENVCASNTCFADTAMSNPISVDVMVTASIDVVPNSTLMAMSPGNRSNRFPSGVRKNCISVLFNSVNA